MHRLRMTSLRACLRIDGQVRSGQGGNPPGMVSTWLRRVGLVEEYEVDSGEGDYHLGVGLMIRMILLAEGRMFWAEVTSSRTGPALLQRVCSEDVNIERENGNRSDTAGLTLANWTTCQQARGTERHTRHWQAS